MVPSKQQSIQIHRAQLRADGVHTSLALSAAVRRGELLRVRRGAYVSVDDWAAAPLWQRYSLAVAATAMGAAHRPTFCRESALLLYGLPLASTPRHVMVRTPAYNWAGVKQPPAMASSTARVRQAQQGSRSTRNIATKYLEPAILPGSTRAEMRAAHRETPVLQTVTLPEGALPGITGPQQYQVEPLGLALVDTVSRMSLPEAVVVLDAAKARHSLDIAPWLGYLRTARQRRNWQRAWEFADSRSESPLESESRAVIAQLGFPPPTLQRPVRTHASSFRLDMCWEEDGVAGEVDGRSKYLEAELRNGADAHQVHLQEKIRREAVEERGWAMARWGKSELREPVRLARRLLNAGLRRTQPPEIST